MERDRGLNFRRWKTIWKKYSIEVFLADDQEKIVSIVMKKVVSNVTKRVQKLDKSDQFFYHCRYFDKKTPSTIFNSRDRTSWNGTGWGNRNKYSVGTGRETRKCPFILWYLYQFTVKSMAERVVGKKEPVL